MGPSAERLIEFSKAALLFRFACDANGFSFPLETGAN
jgi:hypothetical protein